MGILNFCLGIGSLGSSVIFLLLFVTENHDISLFLDLDRKPWLTTCGVRSHGYYGMENPLSWCVPLPFHLTNCFNLSFSNSPACFANSDRPKSKDRYQGKVQTTLEFAFTIEDFDDLVDLCHLYDCCLGPKPLAFVLKKITREEKSMFNFTFSSLIPLFFIGTLFSNFLFCRNGYQVQQR